MSDVTSSWSTNNLINVTTIGIYIQGWQISVTVGLVYLASCEKGSTNKDETIFSLAKDKHNQDFLFSWDLN